MSEEAADRGDFATDEQVRAVWTKRGLRSIDTPSRPFGSSTRPDLIEGQNRTGARQIQERIAALLEMLLVHPLAGGVTGRKGQRRLLAVPCPDAITYRVEKGTVVILGIRHTSRRP